MVRHSADTCWFLRIFLPIDIEVFGFLRAFLIFQFEDFEFQTEKHSNDQIGLRVFSRAAINQAILILKLAKNTLLSVIFGSTGPVS